MPYIVHLVTGFSPVDAARMFMKLMKRLGYEQYYVQGGDWGAVITSIMASLYPKYVYNTVCIMQTSINEHCHPLNQILILLCLYHSQYILFIL